MNDDSLDFGSVVLGAVLVCFVEMVTHSGKAEPLKPVVVAAAVVGVLLILRALWKFATYLRAHVRWER